MGMLTHTARQIVCVNVLYKTPLHRTNAIVTPTYRRVMPTATLCPLFLEAGFLPPSVRDIDVEVRNPVKRQRLYIPEYGRSASDPPLSFARRHANAVEAFKLDSISKPPNADLPKALRSLQSGPVRYGPSSVQDPKLHMFSHRECCGKPITRSLPGECQCTECLPTVQH